MARPRIADTPPGTGPLTARLVLRHARGMWRARGGRIPGAAFVFFVPPALLFFCSEALRDAYAESSGTGRWILLVALVALASVARFLGAIFFAGFLDLAIGDDYFRGESRTLRGVLRDLPWWPLLVVDVVVNVTATNPSAGSFLEVWPSGQARPTASNVNMAPGETIANLVTVAVGANGRVSFYNAVGSTHVVADLVGWYGATGNTYHALGAPNRVLDDRADIGFSGPFGAGFSGFVKIAGFTAVPAGAKGVVMNTTVTNGTAPSFLTVWPVGPAQPNASTINFSANQTIANLAMPALSNGGVLQIANANGTVDVIGDVTGYLAP